MPVAVVFSLMAFVPAIFPAAQAAFPDKPIRMIVPFPAVGNADIVTRPIANELSRNPGVPVVIENRGGRDPAFVTILPR